MWERVIILLLDVIQVRRKGMLLERNVAWMELPPEHLQGSLIENYSPASANVGKYL